MSGSGNSEDRGGSPYSLSRVVAEKENPLTASLPDERVPGFAGEYRLSFDLALR
jgi:hypothetical protein